MSDGAMNELMKLDEFVSELSQTVKRIVYGGQTWKS